MIRHGDIMLKPAPAPRDTTAGVIATSIVLAEGEKTGHSHVLNGAELTLLKASWNRVMVHVPAGADLRHQEHKTINVPPGWYEVVRQRVYTPAGPAFVAD